MTHQPNQAGPPQAPDEKPEPEARQVATRDPVPMSPDDGFGQRWEKRYQVRLAGAHVSPAEVIAAWKEHFGDFWPEGNRFSRSLTNARPGDLAVSDLEMPAGTRLFAGVLIRDISPTSFTFITARGHTFAATITFSAREEAGVTAAEVAVDMRAGDPLYEIGLMLGGHAREDTFWHDTLAALAGYFGVPGVQSKTVTRSDSHRKWRNAPNLVHNAFIRSTIALAGRPVRFVTRRLRERSTTTS